MREQAPQAGLGQPLDREAGGQAVGLEHRHEARLRGKRLIATTVRTRTATGRSSIQRTTTGGTGRGCPERGSVVGADSRSSTSSGPG